MSTLNIQFHDKMTKFPQIFVLLSYWKNFIGLKNEFELAMANEPSVFELPRFHCILYTHFSANTFILWVLISVPQHFLSWKNKKISFFFFC